jgi:hypothetical protein
LSQTAVGEDLIRQALQRQSVVVDSDDETLCDQNSHSDTYCQNLPPNIEVDGIERLLEMRDKCIIEGQAGSSAAEGRRDLSLSARKRREQGRNYSGSS